MISNKNFIDGEIYEHENGNVFKWDKSKNLSSYYIGDNRSRFYKDDCFEGSNAECIASDIDKQWLEACIIAGKTVPLKEIIEQNKFKNQTYEIY